jgi:hypothetical protein
VNSVSVVCMLLYIQVKTETNVTSGVRGFITMATWWPIINFVHVRGPGRNAWGGGIAILNTLRTGCAWETIEDHRYSLMN